MGLRTLVREDLKLRGLQWNKKAPQAVPNKKASNRLEIRRRAESSRDYRDPRDNFSVVGRTPPGSYNRKK